MIILDPFDAQITLHLDSPPRLRILVEHRKLEVEVPVTERGAAKLMAALCGVPVEIMEKVVEACRHDRMREGYEDAEEKLPPEPEESEHEPAPAPIVVDSMAEARRVMREQAVGRVVPVEEKARALAGLRTITCIGCQGSVQVYYAGTGKRPRLCPRCKKERQAKNKKKYAQTVSPADRALGDEVVAIGRRVDEVVARREEREVVTTGSNTFVEQPEPARKIPASYTIPERVDASNPRVQKFSRLMQRFGEKRAKASEGKMVRSR